MTEPPKPLDIRAMSPEQLAVALSNSLRRKIEQEQVKQVAAAGNLLKPDGTIDLIDYAAYLASKVS